MTSYNQVLNGSSQYKTQLIQGLVDNAPLPVYEAVSQSGEPSPNASLFDLFKNRDFRDISRIMDLQYEAFGPINEDLFWSILHHVAGQAGPDGAQLPILKQAEQHIQVTPNKKLFRTWQLLHQAYFKSFIAYAKTIIEPGIQIYTNEKLCELINKLLAFEGFDTLGWAATTYQRTNFVSIAKSKKRILIGPHDVQLSRTRLIGLLIHEVGIHIRWAEHANHTYPAGLEEGIGALVEQLTLPEFHLLRLYRFLAICLAVGVDGSPRAIRQVYKDLLEIRRVLRPEEQEGAAKHFVAKEVVRVYRNLPHDMPGLVYVRDKQYLEHNIEIWGTLAKEEPSLRYFTQLVAPWEGQS